MKKSKTCTAIVPHSTPGRAVATGDQARCDGMYVHKIQLVKAALVEKGLAPPLVLAKHRAPQRTLPHALTGQKTRAALDKLAADLPAIHNWTDELFDAIENQDKQATLRIAKKLTPRVESAATTMTALRDLCGYFADHGN